MFGRTSRKLKLFAIPLLGSLCIAGTGFCVWSFNENDVPLIDIDVPITVSQEVDDGAFNSNSLKTEAGDIALAEQGYLFPKMLVFGEGIGYSQDLTKGLNFYKKVNNTSSSPNLPVLKDHPYLSGETLITYYRPCNHPYEEEDAIYAGGLEFYLKVRIGITKELASIITVLDSYGSKEPIDPMANDGVEYYVCDYRKYILNTYKQTLFTDTGTEIDTYPQLTAEEKGQTYEVYDYHLNFAKVFRYKSISNKPITLKTYKALYDTIKNPDLPTQYLTFQFFAGYRDVKGK